MSPNRPQPATPNRGTSTACWRPPTIDPLMCRKGARRRRPVARARVFKLFLRKRDAAWGPAPTRPKAGIISKVAELFEGLSGRFGAPVALNAISGRRLRELDPPKPAPSFAAGRFPDGNLLNLISAERLLARRRTEADPTPRTGCLVYPIRKPLGVLSGAKKPRVAAENKLHGPGTSDRHSWAGV